MLVALALFTVVITVVTGSLLVLISGNGRLQGEQSVMTNLTFALDSMTREIRTGTHYYCNTGTFSPQESHGTSTQNCDTGSTGLSFREAGTSITGTSNTRIAYYYDSSARTIMRRIGDEGTPQAIVSSGIRITKAEFFVTDARAFTAPTGSENRQPTVTITIEAVEEGVTGGKPFVVQTTVTQRQLDI